MLKLKKIVIHYLYILLLTSSVPTYAQSPVTRENQIKAVFIFNFTQFIEWPASCFATAESPIIIGILGDDPFHNYLEETVSGEKVNGHPLIIQHYKSIEEIKTCHLIFMNLPEINQYEEAIEKLKGQHILTVSNAPDFLKQQGMIRFFIESNKLRIQINPEAAKADNLIISSKLLRLAEIYSTKK